MVNHNTESERDTFVSETKADIKQWAANKPITYYGTDYGWAAKLQGRILDALDAWPNHGMWLKVEIASCAFREGIKQLSTGLNNRSDDTNPLLDVELVPLPYSVNGFWEPGYYPEEEYYSLVKRHHLWHSRRSKLLILVWLYNNLAGPQELIAPLPLALSGNVRIDIPLFWIEHIDIMQEHGLELTNKLLHRKEMEETPPALAECKTGEHAKKQPSEPPRSTESLDYLFSHPLITEHKAGESRDRRDTPYRLDALALHQALRGPNLSWRKEISHHKARLKALVDVLAEHDLLASGIDKKTACLAIAARYGYQLTGLPENRDSNAYRIAYSAFNTAIQLWG